jgi:hypothetical protein
MITMSLISWSNSSSWSVGLVAFFSGSELLGEKGFLGLGPAAAVQRFLVLKPSSVA